MNRILPFIASLFVALSVSAADGVPQEGLMRSHLKMYVVVSVLLIIFAGIVVFLLSMERRLAKLEVAPKPPKGA